MKDSKGKAPDDSTKLGRLRELVAILEGSETLTSLEYEDADIKVKLSRTASIPPAPVAARISPASLSTEETAPEDESLEIVKSPFAGTFYRSPSPTSNPFTEVGATVAPHQVLCVIEAMNEVEGEVSGRVVEIFPENGQAVQSGDPLFKIAVLE